MELNLNYKSYSSVRCFGEIMVSSHDDFWDRYFPGYKKEEDAFERDLTCLLNNPQIIAILDQCGYNAAFLKDLINRLRGMGNRKALETLLKNPSKLHYVLEVFSLVISI
jgi:hypothetical protein